MFSGRIVRVSALLTLTGLIAACEVDPVSERFDDPAPSNSVAAAAEGELLVQVFENGAPTQSTDLVLTLQPLGPTASRLHGDNELSAPIKPGSGWMAEWFDPDASDGPCGPIENYETGNLALRGPEVHGGLGPEVHCIRPGSYKASLSRDGVVLREFDVDYIQMALSDAGGGAPVWNQTAGVSERLIAPAYISRGGANAVSDLILHIDLGSGSFTDTAIIDIDNAAEDPRKSTFQNAPSPTGTDLDHFRMSVARSASNWTRPGLIRGGKALTRFWWDTESTFASPTGYIDAHPAEAGHLLASFRYRNIQESILPIVGVDVKRPDEPASSIPQAERTIQVNKSVSVQNCLTAEATSTWRFADQYLSVGCAPRGAGIQYHWTFTAGGPAIVTSDTMVDFSGHTSSGTHAVSLTAKNAAGTTLGSWSKNFTVSSQYVVIEGPAFVTDKLTKMYTSSLPGRWLERFLPELTYPTPGLVEDTLYRIWPAGDYTVYLRLDTTTNEIRRGRHVVTVCRTNCIIDPEFASLAADNVTSGQGPEAWVFGAGPVISFPAIEANVLAYYDLFGMHERGSPFATKGWLTSQGTVEGPVSIAWSPEPSEITDVSLYSFALVPNQSAEYSFAFAIDPDVGARPEDDRAYHDTARRMAYVTDSDGALGILIVEDGVTIPMGIQQYGSRRLPPASRTVAWNDMKRTSRLLEERDDVQLILSTPLRRGPAQITIALIRAGSLYELRVKADQVIADRKLERIP